MWTRKRTVLAALCILAAGAGVYGYTLVWGKPFVFNHLAERALFRELLEDPELFTLAGIADGSFLDFHSGKLTDASPRQSTRGIARAKQELAILLRYDRNGLGREEQVTFDVLRHYLEMKIQAEAFPYHTEHILAPGPYPVNGWTGIQSELPSFMATTHLVRDARSAKRYLDRLAAIPTKFDQLQESLRMRESIGVLPPRFILESVLDQIRALLRLAPEQSPFCESLARGLGQVKGLDAATREELLRKARELVSGKIYPAYRSLQDLLQRQHAQADERAGVWKLPNGDAYYRYMLRRHTTTDLSPEQVHAIGLREVSRLEGELKEAFAKIGMGGIPLAQAFSRLDRDPAQHFAPGEAGGRTLMATCEAMVADMERHLTTVMPSPMSSQVVVTKAAKHQEATSPMAWASQGSLDGRKPPTFFINLRKPEAVQKFGLRSLTHHEALPGHLYQLTMAQRLKHLPTLRRVYPFNGYTEGWAVYTERLAWEQGLLRDPYDNLGRLQQEQWRAARLVVDTGIHHDRWSREQAVSYLREKTGLPEVEARIEVDRYIAAPGQACSYMIGMLKLLELRAGVQQARGDAFSLKDFHALVLSKGSMPLGILERTIREDAGLPQAQ